MRPNVNCTFKRDQCASVRVWLSWERLGRRIDGFVPTRHVDTVLAALFIPSHSESGYLLLTDQWCLVGFGIDGVFGRRDPNCAHPIYGVSAKMGVWRALFV
jgi:hypothetical protein